MWSSFVCTIDQTEPDLGLLLIEFSAVEKRKNLCARTATRVRKIRACHKWRVEKRGFNTNVYSCKISIIQLCMYT